MRKALLQWLLVALSTCGALAAQGDLFEQLRLRVASVRPNGQCVVDRGSRDHVQTGDRIVLEPRGGGTLVGRVEQVDGRTCLVQLLDPKASVPLGTRGHVLLPKARLAAIRKPAAPQPGQPPAGQAPAGQASGNEPNRGQGGNPAAGDPAGAGDEQEVWRPGMPLLGRHRAPRPDERASKMRGRLYGIANLVRTNDSFGQSFLTAGADVDINNVGGTGGNVRFHGQFNRSEEFSGNTGNDLRLFELSYEHGGNRFDAFHWQAGRFLPRDVPEFGLLDGIQAGFRREGGDRFGASFGYLPELDDDLESLADLQVAFWYVWNQDIGERVTYTLGYQKTWHRFDGDRDLILAKARFLPTNGWDVSTSLWVDIYDNDDVIKDQNFEVTRANVFAGRRWQNEGGIELFYDHEEYPDLLRNENPQTLLPQTLIGAHLDRISGHFWVRSGEASRWFTRLTGWVDEEGEGGAGEFGFAWRSSRGDGATRTAIALFHIEALTNNLGGVRIEHGGDYSVGRLDFLYELGLAHFTDRPAESNDLIQHRIGALLTTDLGGGWDATFNADTTFWDSEISYGVGIYLQRLF